MIKLKKYS